MKNQLNANNINLPNEILKEASELPPECQEQVLLSIRAMNFTKKVILKELNSQDEKRMIL
ncbi:hypothetical protein IR151_18420 [Clostridioides sp. ES-S-0006-03]|uniref:hypothetical protein n=1 Tax=Clostridioides sp. ES-S-0006-03 TaxID=2770775 RepID=UPI001D0C27F0|nr:hypothetical protein [Clostridioides sp. ES-S-0006-03]